jgi:hypothetical protein
MVTHSTWARQIPMQQTFKFNNYKHETLLLKTQHILNDVVNFNSVTPVLKFRNYLLHALELHCETSALCVCVRACVHARARAL